MVNCRLKEGYVIPITVCLISCIYLISLIVVVRVHLKRGYTPPVIHLDDNYERYFLLPLSIYHIHYVSITFSHKLSISFCVSLSQSVLSSKFIIHQIPIEKERFHNEAKTLFQFFAFLP